jgi:hypothetical protein
MTAVLPTSRLSSGSASPSSTFSARTGIFSSSRNHEREMVSGNNGAAAVAAADYRGGALLQQQQRTQMMMTTHDEDEEEQEEQEQEEQERERAQLSIVAMLLDTVRRSLMASCQAVKADESPETLEIGWPTDVQHVAHVTFDRYNGFLGLPEEFEVEVPLRAPSASQNVFGVSAESMQCAFDTKGNSVPMILLLMQERLYHEGGLKAEGIFRITAENSHEEHVRDQLNKGIVPVDIDVHCLAGLIKVWLSFLFKFSFRFIFFVTLLWISKPKNLQEMKTKLSLQVYTLDAIHFFLMER